MLREEESTEPNWAIHFDWTTRTVIDFPPQEKKDMKMSLFIAHHHGIGKEWLSKLRFLVSPLPLFTAFQKAEGEGSESLDGLWLIRGIGRMWHPFPMNLWCFILLDEPWNFISHQWIGFIIENKIHKIMNQRVLNPWNAIRLANSLIPLQWIWTPLCGIIIIIFTIFPIELLILPGNPLPLLLVAVAVANSDFRNWNQIHKICIAVILESCSFPFSEFCWELGRTHNPPKTPFFKGGQHWTRGTAMNASTKRSQNRKMIGPFRHSYLCKYFLKCFHFNFFFFYSEPSCLVGS